MKVNVSKEVTLNCSASSLPHPIYTWFIPDYCSSCPEFSNNSVITFTADIFSNGDYICVAENDYGSATKHITISVLCKILSVSYLQVYCCICYCSVTCACAHLCRTLYGDMAIHVVIIYIDLCNWHSR